MDIDVITGAAGTVPLGDRTLTIAQLSFTDLGKLRAWAKERVARPFQTAAQAVIDLAPLRDVDPELYESEKNRIILEARLEAKEGDVNEALAKQRLAEPDGVAYALYLSASRNHPELTHEQVQAALDKATPEELLFIQEKLDTANTAWMKLMPEKNGQAGRAADSATPSIPTPA